MNIRHTGACSEKNSLRKAWRIEPIPFGVNYKHTNTCLLSFLFGGVEL